jgi:hypothetical protein
LLGFLSEFGYGEFRARRARKTAALLIYGELTGNLAAVSALRKFGVWTTERIHRSAWEAQGAALLYRADVDRVGPMSPRVIPKKKPAPEVVTQEVARGPVARRFRVKKTFIVGQLRFDEGTTVQLDGDALWKLICVAPGLLEEVK